jgi:hypothetical protein
MLEPYEASAETAEVVCRLTAFVSTAAVRHHCWVEQNSLLVFYQSDDVNNIIYLFLS